MVLITIKKNVFYLHENIGNEDILKEYKEFFLKKSLTLDDIEDLKKGLINNKVIRYTEESIIYYFDKYYQRYLLSMSNIDKRFLKNIEDKNFSNFYIGIGDNGKINGIPYHKDYLLDLVDILENKLSCYYNNIIGLHKKKGTSVIKVNNNIYYDFNNLISILKKHTKINIHILGNNNNHNPSFHKLMDAISNSNYDESIYKSELNIYKLKKKIKKEYNDIYSTAFYRLIRRNDVMLQFKNYILTFISFDFDNFIKLLQKKIVAQDDVLKYLDGGYYITGTLFPDDDTLDYYYGNIMRNFLEYYKHFKRLMLKKNIVIEPFSLKSPRLKLNPLLKNISCFNKHLFNNKDIIYIMIHIELPFIKDNNVFLGLKDKQKIKILGRTYRGEMPCTQIDK
jgi:hypothetical protein